MRRSSTHSETSSESSMSSAFSSQSEETEETRTIHNTHYNNNNSNNAQFFAKFVRETRSKVEQKTSEINATMQEKLPEWKQRGALYSNKARETGIEWSRRGKVAVDRWKNDRAEDESSTSFSNSSSYPHVQKDNAVFGMPLEIAIALTKIDSEDLIPAIFRRCIEYLDDIGVHEVGIYRIPGSTITVNKLRAVFDDGSNIDFHETKPDPHAVGTLLKMYLRELPEPIIPVELTKEYAQQFMKSIQSSNDADKKAMEETINVTTSLTTVDTSKLPPVSNELLKTVRSITARLPIYSFCLLQLLCRHLKRVADNEQENRMSASNLALIFIPTLNIGRALFHCMVEHYCQVFEGGNGNSPSMNKKSTSIIPPPLPQKPRNLSAGNSTLPSPIIKPSPRKIFHSKTMSDTAIDKTSNSFLPKVPPPKPNRSPLPQSSSSSTSVNQCKLNSHTLPPPPRLPRHAPPKKPRSKSVSSPMPHYTEGEEGGVFWKQIGRVEAIGKQFETLMNIKTATSPTSSFRK